MLDHLGELRRSHNCGALRPADEGQRVTLMGWVHKRRDLGSLTFIDLRDRYGLTQLVFNPEFQAESHGRAKVLRSEFVIAIVGEVRRRDPATVNPRIETGAIEVWVEKLVLLNTANTPPFPIEDNLDQVGEELRYRYRFLDLRRARLQRNFILRHRIALACRNYLDQKNFLELETPMLTKSTPEGARDYLVPSRVQKGRFYALPQSPQIFKQLFMVAGFERYVQITRCFRDEDLRADRQPEFTQIDMEMSFVQREDVLELVEGMMAEVFRVAGVQVATPFPRMSYAQAMSRYGSDKPDLRFNLPIHDFSPSLRGCSFQVFANCLAQNGAIQGLCAPAANRSRKDIEGWEEWLRKDFGISGLAWLKWTQEGISGSILKFVGQETAQALFEQAGGTAGDLLLLLAGPANRSAQALGALRLHLAKELGLIDEQAFAPLWVLDFPLLELDAEQGRYVACHHPFTSPMDEDLALLESEPGEVRAKAYDLVLNGFEIGGGSIRIHRRDVQAAMFRALGLSDEEAQDKFGFLLDALSFGAPPHGGIALGLDRISMILAGEKSLKEVIAFPKTTSATCLMTETPSEVSVHQLLDLGIQVLPQN
jgi:aspartyl-tRNA synthetase